MTPIQSNPTLPYDNLMMIKRRVCVNVHIGSKFSMHLVVILLLK